MRRFWLADSRHMIAEQAGKLLVFDSVTKTEREILSFEPQYISSPYLTHDNKLLVLSIGTIEGDIQMLSLK